MWHRQKGLRKEPKFARRQNEFFLLSLIALLAFMGFALVEIARRAKQDVSPWASMGTTMLPPLILTLCLFVIHFALSWRKFKKEQILWPATAFLLTIGLIMLFRLRPLDTTLTISEQIGLLSGCVVGGDFCPTLWQQVARGLLPGIVAALFFILHPTPTELIRSGKRPLFIGLFGLILLFATAFMGVQQGNARLALKIGPLPAIQTSEMIKFTLIIFLASFIENTHLEANGNPMKIGWFQIPGVKLLLPALLFVGVALLFLVKMSDWGAVLILGLLFTGMLYLGTEPKLFANIILIGLVATLIAGTVLFAFWEPPQHIQNRWLVYQDPWSETETTHIGVPTTVSDGPGQQAQHSINAILAGDVMGTGLGFAPERIYTEPITYTYAYVPENTTEPITITGITHVFPVTDSDYILSPIIEELGLVILLPILVFFGILIWRISRLGLQLADKDDGIFEAVFLTGIAIHLALQVLVMSLGVTKAIPATGVTVAFLSQGGMALLVNLVEVGLALSLLYQLEGGA